MPETATTVQDELAAMRRIANTLDKIDPATRDRIVGWLFDRYHQPADAEPQR